MSSVSKLYKTCTHTHMDQATYTIRDNYVSVGSKQDRSILHRTDKMCAATSNGEGRGRVGGGVGSTESSHIKSRAECGEQGKSGPVVPK